MKFPGRNAVAVGAEQPDRREPLIQADGRIFHDGAGLEGELAFRVVNAALPAIMLRLELNAVGSTDRARHDSFRPASRNHVLTAIGGILKVSDCFQKSCGRMVFHDLTISICDGIVNYIFT